MMLFRQIVSGIYKIIFCIFLIDINECQKSPSVCLPLAKCSNAEGSFSCQCETGYIGDGIVNCSGMFRPLQLFYTPVRETLGGSIRLVDVN